MPSVRMAVGLIVVFLILSGTATAQSQPPPPTALKASQKYQSRSDNSQTGSVGDKQGTEKSPVVVKILPIPQSQEESRNYAAEKKEKASADRWQKVLAACLVGVGVLQLVIFGLQAKRLRQTVETMKDTAERDLRAYIFAEEFQVSAATLDGEMIDPIREVEAGSRPFAVLKIKNFGKTPAYNVEMYGGLVLAGWPLNPSDLPPLDFSMEGSRESIAPSNHRLKLEIAKSARPPLTAEDIDRLRKGTHAIYVYGEVRYRDAFNNDRHTRYRYFIGGVRGLRGCALGAHQEGNEAN